MMWIALSYFYLAGLFPALHIASDAPGHMHIGKVLFALCWPVVCPPIYAWAIIKAVRE